MNDNRSTLRQLRSQVMTQLALRDGQKISRKAVDDKINKIIRRLNLEFGILKTSWSATSVADKVLYPLPKNMERLEKGYFDDIPMTLDTDQPVSDIKDLEAATYLSWTEQP